MGTRASISVKMGVDAYQGIYLHYDGYVSHAGKMLAAHYASQELAEALVAGGDISSLDASCTGAPGHTFANPVKGQTVYYGRDRGEKNTKPQKAHTYDLLVHDIGQEFDYLWDGNQWLVRAKNGTGPTGAQLWRLDPITA